MVRSSPALRLVAVGAALAAAVCGLLSWWTWSPGLTDRLRDDAYYEYVWAIQLAQGAGGTVSDGVSTSGVQWLWTLALAGLVRCAGPGALAVAPLLGGLLHFVAAAIWWRMPRDRATGAVLALCWVGHPLLLREALNGQETALAAACATALVALRDRREGAFAPAAVAAVLARSDLFALVLGLSIWRHRGRILGAIPTPAIALASLAALNLTFGGGLLQDSALPMSWLWHSNLERVWGFWSSQWWYARPVLLGGPFALASAFGFGVLAFLLLRPLWPRRLRVLPLVGVAVAAALGAGDLAVPGWCALLLALRPRRRARPVRGDLLAIALGLGAVVALHWAIRWYPRDYYLAPLVVGAFAAVARAGRWRLALLALPLAQLVDLPRVQPEPLAGQAAMALAGQRLHEVLPEGERVGCFNSGIVTYLADVSAPPGRRRGVVNLDGVVDRRSFAALQAHALGAWLDEQQVRFVLDGPAQFSLDPSVPHACGRFFGGGFEPSRDLVEVARFAARSVRGGAAREESMRLYWRKGRGALPTPRDGLPFELLEPDALRWSARAGDTLLVESEDGEPVVLEAVDVDTVVFLQLRDGELDPTALRVERR